MGCSHCVKSSLCHTLNRWKCEICVYVLGIKKRLVFKEISTKIREGAGGYALSFL